MSWLIESERTGSRLDMVLTNHKANRGARHDRQSYRFEFQEDERGRITRITPSTTTFGASKAIGDGGQKWRIAKALEGGAKNVADIATATGITAASIYVQLTRNKDMFTRLNKDDAKRVLWGNLTNSGLTPINVRNDLTNRGGSLEPQLGVRREEGEEDGEQEEGTGSDPF